MYGTLLAAVEPNAAQAKDRQPIGVTLDVALNPDSHTGECGRKLHRRSFGIWYVEAVHEQRRHFAPDDDGKHRDRMADRDYLICILGESTGTEQENNIGPRHTLAPIVLCSLPKTVMRCVAVHCEIW